MRILSLFAVTVLAFACGGGKPKGQSSMVNEGDTSPTCCCKTIPTTAEKEIVPVYAQANRMECSSNRGDCVDDVQCNGQEGGDTTQQQPSNDGVPPPPVLEPSTGTIQ
ncbi:MAG TPA: hypothetical protein VMZ53_29735 [Kofleriaceae bacterium]|nr:hypothetical protein [Kofleriaceae bacterium]